MPELPQVDPIRAAIAKLAQQLTPVAVERVALKHCHGRYLANALSADRDSPSLDVSAMDGYAVRLADVGPNPLPVQATSPAGSPPLQLTPGQAIRIFTGAAVPATADCVVRREDTLETEAAVTIQLPAAALQAGQNIRRRGENTRQGAQILPAGQLLDAAAIAALASFGPAVVDLRRKVKVAILNTGDELAEPGAAVEAWQIRDSNGPTLETWLQQLPWLEVVWRGRVADRYQAVCDAIAEQLEHCDALLLTGGVSMGDTDFVPAAVRDLGGHIAFHRLPIRPGKPVLGAALQGKLILGLPGNPVSVAVTSRVLGGPLLQCLAGGPPYTLRPRVPLADADAQQLDLTWFRLVHIDGEGQVRLVSSRGSGDLVSLSQSHGFIEMPAGQSGPGPWQLSLW